MSDEKRGIRLLGFVMILIWAGTAAAQMIDIGKFNGIEIPYTLKFEDKVLEKGRYDLEALKNPTTPSCILFFCSGSSSNTRKNDRSRIVFQGTRIEHWLNGVKVVEADTASESFKTSLAVSKFAKIEGFARKKKGHISLQDHNGAYAFRNLKIRELPRHEELER